jgi:competence protein ComEC
MVVMPRLARFFYGERKPGFVGSTVLMTVSATVMTLPIALYYYGQVSLISVVANLLILPTLPFAMGVTFMAGVVSGVPVVELMVGWVARMVLQFHIAVVEFLGQQKSFLFEMEAKQPAVFLIYGVILVLMVFGNFKKNDTMCL